MRGPRTTQVLGCSLENSQLDVNPEVEHSEDSRYNYLVLKKLIARNLVILIIIFLSAVLRFTNIDKLTTFGGDQGYDFAIVRKMLVTIKPTLLGPKIGPYNEIGNLYLGPAYYYLLAPSLYFFKYDPIGPAFLTVSLSLATIFLIYIIALKFLSYKTAVFASSIYAFSSFLINQSRAASNPHLIPFFASLVLLSLLVITNKKSKSLIWPLAAGLSLGIMFQLHYLATALLASSLIFLLISKNFKVTLIVIVSFILGILPQIIFELRHEFFVTNIFIAQLKLGGNISTMTKFGQNFLESFGLLSLIISESRRLFILFVILIAAAFFRKTNNKSLKPVLILLVLNLGFGLVFTSVYSGELGPHYFATIYPTACILIGITFAHAYETFKNIFARAAISSLLLYLLATNIFNLDLNRQEGYTMPKGMNLPGIKKASSFISEDVKLGVKFNIASALDGDTRARPYRYLVDVYGKSPQDVEKYPQSDVIYLISQDEEEAIRSYTVWEVASFAPFDFAARWEIQNGIHLYKLVKNRS